MSALPTYSSLTAFLEHYRILRAAKSRDAAEEKTFAAMTSILEALAPPERAALDGADDDSAHRRHRERALVQLAHELAARGALPR